MLKLYEILRKVSRVLVLVSYVCLLGSTVFIMVDIVMRYCFACPILGDVEIIEIVMAVMVFASFAYTQTEKGHIHVLLLLKVLPERLRLALFGVNGLIVAVASGAVTYGCFMQGGYTLRKHMVSAIIHVPYFPFYYFASLCMAVFTVVLLLDALITLAALFRRDYADLVQSTWG